MTWVNMQVRGLVGVAHQQSPTLKPSQQTGIRTVTQSRMRTPNCHRRYRVYYDGALAVPAVAEIDVVEHEGGDLGDPGGVDRREGEDEPRRRGRRSCDGAIRPSCRQGASPRPREDEPGQHIGLELLRFLRRGRRSDIAQIPYDSQHQGENASRVPQEACGAQSEVGL